MTSLRPTASLVDVPTPLHLPPGQPLLWELVRYRCSGPIGWVGRCPVLSIYPPVGVLHPRWEGQRH